MKYLDSQDDQKNFLFSVEKQSIGALCSFKEKLGNLENITKKKNSKKPDKPNENDRFFEIYDIFKREIQTL